MNERGRLSANTGITAHSDTNPTNLPRRPSGVVPGMTTLIVVTEERVRAGAETTREGEAG